MNESVASRTRPLSAADIGRSAAKIQSRASEGSRSKGMRDISGTFYRAVVLSQLVAERSEGPKLCIVISHANRPRRSCHAVDLPGSLHSGLDGRITGAI